jgi:hypothetical protein
LAKYNVGHSTRTRRRREVVMPTHAQVHDPPGHARCRDIREDWYSSRGSPGKFPGYRPADGGQLSSEPDIVTITRISTTARPISSVQRADAIMRQMVASGQLNWSVLRPTRQCSATLCRKSIAWVQLRRINWLLSPRKRRQTRPLGFSVYYFGTRRSKVQILSPDHS